MPNVGLLAMSAGICNFVEILSPSSIFTFWAAFAATGLIRSSLVGSLNASVDVDFKAPVMPQCSDSFESIFDCC